LRAGPLALQFDGFVAALLAQGYGATSIRAKLTFVAQLGRWLERRRLAPEALDDARVREFLRARLRRYRGAAAAAATTHQLLRYLRAAAVVPQSPAARPRYVAARVEAAFAEHLRRERALADVTITSYVNLVRPFLTGRGQAPGRSLARVRAKDVTRFVVQQARRLGPGCTKLLVTALRSLLRFLHWTGTTPTDLAPCVPRVADWRHARLPKYIPAADVQRLIRSCDLCRPAGRRDHAVLLLIARLGLRACEVVRMTLDDLDWKAGELRVRGKGARLDRLPLPREVGDALVTYLRDPRPPGVSRRVFLCARAPRRGLSHSSTVSTIVRRAIERAGLQPPSRGAHLLRHSLATTLLRRGAPLAEIGSLLRHHSPDTTTLYAKVDLASLRDIALPWPGGAA
jgi:site-specific recombinase XerD